MVLLGCAAVLTVLLWQSRGKPGWEPEAGAPDEPHGAGAEESPDLHDLPVAGDEDVGAGNEPDLESASPPSERPPLQEPEEHLEPSAADPLVEADQPEPEPESEAEPESEPELASEPEPEPASEPAGTSEEQAAKAEPQAAAGEAEQGAAEPEPPFESAEESPATRAQDVFLQLAKRVPSESRGLLRFFARWQAAGGPSPEERRAGVERLTCDLPAVCVSDSQRWEVRVTNLGLGGLEMAHPQALLKGTRLAVLPHGYSVPVAGRVLWTRPGAGHCRLGLHFDQDLQTLSQSWVALTMLELGAEFLLGRVPRKFVRVETRIPSSLILDDGAAIEVVLRDVSLGGCLLQSGVPFQVSEITLRLGDVGCRGLVVNARPGEPEEGWLHHVRFHPMGRRESASLRRTISLLMRSNP